MTVEELTDRLLKLEQQVAELQNKSRPPAERPGNASAPANCWWREPIFPAEDLPTVLEAAELGRQYRESLRPSPRKKVKRDPT